MLALASTAVSTGPRAAPAPAAAGHLRNGDLLRRRRHHAGDLGAVGGRGPGGRRARVCTPRRADHARRADRAVPRAAARHGRHRPLLRARHGASGSSCWRVLGVLHIARNPAVLWALSPHHALLFIATHPHIAFIALGSVVLCVTGAEALYADMGHFGKRPIRLAWFGLAMPALVINYFGQGAMLLAHPENARNPFYEMAPAWALYPADRPGHLRDGDRLAGADHGGVLGHQAGDPARLPAAHAHLAHLGARDRAGLPAVHQLALLRLHLRRRRAVRLEQQARGGLRHHGHDRHADHDDDDLLRHPLRLEVPLVAVHRSDRLLLRRRLHVLRRQRRQGARRRLVPAGARRRDVHLHDDLEAGPHA